MKKWCDNSSELQITWFEKWVDPTDKDQVNLLEITLSGCSFRKVQNTVGSLLLGVKNHKEYKEAEIIAVNWDCVYGENWVLPSNFSHHRSTEIRYVDRY